MLALIILNLNQGQGQVQGPVTLVSVQTGIIVFALEILQYEKKKLMEEGSKGM